MSKILILSHSQDESAKLVRTHLYKKGVESFLFNTEDFPVNASMWVRWRDGGVDGSIHSPEGKINLQEVGAIWNRRPRQPIASTSITDTSIREWAASESTHALRYLWSLLDGRFWLNPVFPEDKPRLNKWVQMRLADRLGLMTPASIMTNDPDTAFQFWEEQDRDVIVKVVKTGHVEQDDGSRHLLFTSRIDEKSMLDETLRARINLSPVFLQRRVDKEFELRITIVGDQVFTCKIDSQVEENTKDDWRKQFANKSYLPHSIFMLPQNIEDKCHELVRKLGLVFGAIDMIVNRKGEYVFLEINPNGQWGWVENLTGMPISLAIAEQLVAHIS